MTAGSKEKYTAQQKRKAQHIEAGYEAQREQAKPYALEEQPLATLRAKARKKHISGRSSMSKVELIQALRRS